MSRVVIVGAAASGLATAEALRRFRFDGEIVVIGDEVGRAYDRPPLSKQVLAGEWDEEKAALLPPARVERIGADLRLGRRATGLDAHRRQLQFEDGSTIDYDEAVIATGVRPRRLPGADWDDVHVLRTLADCRRLGEALRRHRRLVIVGAGFIGLEVAATARKLGAEVTLVEPLERPLANRIGAYTAGRLLDLHAAAGVEIRCGTGVSAIARSEEPQPAIRGVVTSDGSVVDSPVVLVAIGCVPNVEWLAQSGLDISDGVRCDAHCQAAPHIWAAGDVARWNHLGLGRELRIEHRMNATEQATTVAANIMGQRRAFTPVPFFWTDHYQTKIQLAGVMPPHAEERTEAGADDDDSFVHSFWADGRPVGVLGWNAAKAMMPLRRTLDLSQPVAA
jgi:NADPH-dependent 2,4-dienoyl-CoA reductase/sulfur reductase-like enzyme